MHCQHREPDDAPLRLQLELHLEREPICGRLRCDRGEDEEFVGWLGFVEALRRVAEARTDRRDRT
jgi:hypothetical protein